MALKPQVSPLLSDLLAAGMVRTGTVPGELFNPDGTPLAPGGMSKAAAVANATGAGGDPVTVTKFNELLTSLRNAGLLST